jgi:hypothetical protein
VHGFHPSEETANAILAANGAAVGSLRYGLLRGVGPDRSRAGGDGDASAVDRLGTNVYQKVVASLKVPGTSVFSETASLSGARSGGDSGFSYVWPVSAQFRVENALARLDPVTYQPVLRAFSDEVFGRYWKTSGGGYRSGVSSGATRFYDDNAHMAVALAEAYRITGDTTYLDRAKRRMRL